VYYLNICIYGCVYLYDIFMVNFFEVNVSGRNVLEDLW
jgi:hypothetical protein